MKRLQHTGMVFSLWLLNTQMSWAAGVGGTGLPWDQPMNTIATSLYGTPAHSMVTAVIVFSGLAWAFTDHQIGARRVFAGAAGGALAINAPDVMNALGWGGALM